MLHGLLWLPLILIFVLLTALGWLERRRQNLFRNWANGSEICKLDSSGGALLKDGEIKEMEKSKSESFCCGAGGGNMWYEIKTGERINQNRIKQAVDTLHRQ